MSWLSLYQPGLSFRRNADVFQRHAEVMKNGIEIGQRVLAHAHEGILTLVRLAQKSLRAHPFVSVDEFLYHCIAFRCFR